MNKSENIFERVQKQTPFRTPEGFFELQEQKLKDKVPTYHVQRKPLHRTWFYAAAASLILIGGIYGITRWLVQPSSDTVPVYSRTTSLSDDWSEFAEADVFLDNMNW